jgi:hypothetical protein
MSRVLVDKLDANRHDDANDLFRRSNPGRRAILIAAKRRDGRADGYVGLL